MSMRIADSILGKVSWDLGFLAEASVESTSEGLSVFDVCGIILASVGLVFFLGAAVGLYRFPDFYTRMHAAGKGDTLSSLLILLGFGLITLDDFSMVGWLLVIKVLAIVLFIMLTSPTSTHVLMRAGYEDGVEPVTKGSSSKSTKKEGEL
tara:strand:- start:2227 stop:2676 length:450 start_codon:yes stop_codon:yes gene_type:complete